jgi:hypothetical protein
VPEILERINISSTASFLWTLTIDINLFFSLCPIELLLAMRKIHGAWPFPRSVLSSHGEVLDLYSPATSSISKALQNSEL